MTDKDSAVRYWAVLGIHMCGAEHVTTTRTELRRALEDKSPHVEIAAAQALAQFGNKEDLSLSLPHLVARADWSRNDVFVSMAALNSLDALEDKAVSVAADLRLLPIKGPAPDPRYSGYVPRLLQDLNARFR